MVVLLKEKKSSGKLKGVGGARFARKGVCRDSTSCCPLSPHSCETGINSSNALISSQITNKCSGRRSASPTGSVLNVVGNCFNPSQNSHFPYHRSFWVAHIIEKQYDFQPIRWFISHLPYTCPNNAI